VAARPAFLLVLCMAAPVWLGGCVGPAQYRALQARVNQLESRVDRDEHAMLTVDAKCDATSATVAEAVIATRDVQRLAADNRRLATEQRAALVEQRAALAEAREGLAQVRAMMANAQRAGAVLKPVGADSGLPGAVRTVAVTTAPVVTSAAACAAPKPLKVTTKKRM